MTAYILLAAMIFLMWRAGGRLAYWFGWRGHACEYHWWFAWRPIFLYGPDEWDRERMLDKSPRLIWLLWVMRMPTSPRFYHVRPNWQGSRYLQLED